MKFVHTTTKNKNRFSKNGNAKIKRAAKIIQGSKKSVIIVK